MRSFAWPGLGAKRGAMEGQHLGEDGEQVAGGVDTSKVPVGDEAPKRGTKKKRKQSSGSFFTSYVVGQRLLIALLGLDEEDLEKFKRGLREFPVRAGFVPIPEAQLQRATAGETSGLLLCYYGEDYAVQVAEGTLRAAGCALQADWLRRSLAELDIQDRLLGALSALSQEELERFKGRLRQEEAEEGRLSPDLEARLDSAGARELSALLFRFGGGDLAAKTTEERLRAIGCQTSADKLLDLTGNEAEQPSFILEGHSSCVEQAEGFSSHSSKTKQGLEREVSIGEGTEGLLNPVMRSGTELLCKGGRELIRILERDHEHILFKLLSHFVITMDEYKGLVKRKEDSREKCRKLLITIQERGERACCRFLECVEMVCPDSIRLLRQVADNDSRAPFTVSGDVRPHLAKEKGRPKTDAQERVACNLCPNGDLPEAIKPKVIWNSKINHEAYRFCPTEAGSFHCCYTDLIFEVRGAVTITYQFDSWEKHRSVMDAQDLMIAGPLLHILVDPVEAVTAVHFPHFLCLAGEDSSQIHIAHFIDEEMNLEEPNRVEPFHAVLENPKFSSRGAVLKKSSFKQNIKVHAMALLYQVLEITTPKFHLYLLPNDSSLRKAVEDYEQNCPSWRVPKPSWTSKPLLIGSHLVMQDLDAVTVRPEELEFQYLDADMEQQYFELYGHRTQDKLVLQVVEKDKEELVWEAVVREEELKSPVLHPAPEEF